MKSWIHGCGEDSHESSIDGLVQLRRAVQWRCSEVARVMPRIGVLRPAIDEPFRKAVALGLHIFRRSDGHQSEHCVWLHPVRVAGERERLSTEAPEVHGSCWRCWSGVMKIDVPLRVLLQQRDRFCKRARLSLARTLNSALSIQKIYPPTCVSCILNFTSAAILKKYKIKVKEFYVELFTINYRPALIMLCNFSIIKCLLAVRIKIIGHTFFLQ
jgi:hypothetical protein